LYGGGTFESLDIISGCVMYIGVNGLSFVRRSNIWVPGCNVVGFMYIGVRGSTFVQRSVYVWVTGYNVVGFYVYRFEGLIIL